MRLKPARTNASDLDDDELILFDFLWENHAPIKFLYADAFALHANTPYTHLIPHDELRPRLLALVERNLLFLHQPMPAVARVWRSDVGFGLTKQGFAAWESERLPDWSRYLYDSTSDDTFTVRSVSERIGICFIEACRKCGLLSTAASEAIHSVEKDVELVPWNVFAEVHCFEISDSRQVSAPVNWPLYESNRIWWRGTFELWTPGQPSP